jgi:hypothetical protein
LFIDVIGLTTFDEKVVGKLPRWARERSYKCATTVDGRESLSNTYP